MISEENTIIMHYALHQIRKGAGCKLLQPALDFYQLNL